MVAVLSKEKEEGGFFFGSFGRLWEFGISVWGRYLRRRDFFKIGSGVTIPRSVMYLVLNPVAKRGLLRTRAGGSGIACFLWIREMRARTGLLRTTNKGAMGFIAM